LLPYDNCRLFVPSLLPAWSIVDDACEKRNGVELSRSDVEHIIPAITAITARLWRLQ
jgi:hypothetical protein